MKAAFACIAKLVLVTYWSKVILRPNSNCLQAELLPFTKALSAFHDRVLAAGAQPNAAAEEINAKSFDKVLKFVKTLAKATSAYPPAMAENVTFMVR